MQVPVCDFAGYVRAITDELYAPLVAAVDGRLTGPGTLGTVMLCECLLTLLSSWQLVDQPTNLFKRYGILPLSSLQQTRKIDLSRFANVQNGVLYISKPAIQRVWIPYSSLSSACRVKATKIIDFLQKLQAGRNSLDAVLNAAKIIVGQFLIDMEEMGIVDDKQVFQGRLRHGCIREAQTADEYVARVFIPDRLPSRMSTKAFLQMALDLFGQSVLLRKVTKELLEVANLVPEAKLHNGRVTFSTCFRIVLVHGPACAETISRQDAHRLVMASTHLLQDHFGLGRGVLKAVQASRPQLSGCVVEAVRRARTRTGCLRHLLRVVAYTVMYLAQQEGLLSWRPNYQSLYRSFNLNRYRELEEIVSKMLGVAEEQDRRQVQLRVSTASSYLVTVAPLLAPTS